MSAAADRLTRREAELTAAFTAYRADCDTKFAEASQIRNTLERQLNDTSLALDETKKARAVDASAAARRLIKRESELTSAFTAYRAECEAKFAEAAQIRGTLERQLKDTSLALDETAQIRDTLERQLKDTSLELDDTKKTWAMDASAAADLLTKREAELTAYRAESEAKLAEAANTRRTLEQQLKDAIAVPQRDDEGRPGSRGAALRTRCSVEGSG